MSSPVDRPLALFQRYPQLVERGDHVDLGVAVSPVERCRGLEDPEFPEVSLFVKRDDIVCTRYGGNKARKLEFILGQALHRGAKLVVSGGATGSNQAVALAVFCKQLGLDTELVLWNHPPGVDVQASRSKLEQLGARVKCVNGSARFLVCLGWRFANAWLRSVVGQGPRPWLVAPGGSNPWSVLAYVNAGLELAEQIRNGTAPLPTAVYVAVGSGGTVAGLVVGLRLAGISSKVVGVQVADPPFCSSWVVQRLANGTLRSLRRWKCSVKHGLRIGAGDFSFVRGYRGRGYAYVTDAGEAAVRKAAQVGLTLEPTYTGKAFAAFLDAARRPGAKGQTLLFFDTVNSRPVFRQQCEGVAETQEVEHRAVQAS